MDLNFEVEMKRQIGARKVLSMGVYRIKNISEIVDILKTRAKEDPFVQELLKKYGFDTSVIDNLPVNVMVNRRAVSPYGYFSPSKRSIFLQIPFFAKEHLLNSIQAEIKECEREIGGYRRRLNEAQRMIKELEKQSAKYANPDLLSDWKRTYDLYIRWIAEKEEYIKFLQEKLKDLEGKSEEELYQMGEFEYKSRDDIAEATYDTFIHELRHYLDWLYKKQKQIPREQRIPDIRKRRKPWYQRDEEISAMVTEIKRWQNAGLSEDEIKGKVRRYTSYFINFDSDKFVEDVLAGKYDNYFEPRRLGSIKLSDRRLADSGGDDIEYYKKYMDETVQDFERGKPKQKWVLVSKNDLKRLFILDARGAEDQTLLDKVTYTVKEILERLQANSILLDEGALDSYIPEVFYDEDKIERFKNFISDEEGEPRRSQYLWTIKKYIPKLTSGTYKERLLALNAVINYAHQEGSCAKWFVEGGNDTLDEIENDMKRYTYMPTRRGSIRTKVVLSDF